MGFTNSYSKRWLTPHLFLLPAEKPINALDASNLRRRAHQTPRESVRARIILQQSTAVQYVTTELLNVLSGVIAWIIHTDSTYYRLTKLKYIKLSLLCVGF